MPGLANKVETILKSRVKAHTRTTKTGKLVPVREHIDKRTKKQQIVKPEVSPTVLDDKETARRRKHGIPLDATNIEYIKGDRNLSATYIDNRGRKQHKYKQAHTEQAAKKKFRHMRTFAKSVPKIRRAVSKDLQLGGIPPDKVVAAIVRLIDVTHIRRGSEIYAQDNQTFGAATLRKSHVKVNGNKVTLNFHGKKGIKFHETFNMPELAPILSDMLKLSGDMLFQYESDGKLKPLPEHFVNRYLSKFKATPKDFRSYSASRIFAEKAAEYDGNTEALRKKSVIRAVKDAAKALNNSPAVCKSQYIDPICMQAFQAGHPLGVVYAKSLTEIQDKETKFNEYLDWLAENYVDKQDDDETDIEKSIGTIDEKLIAKLSKNFKHQMNGLAKKAGNVPSDFPVQSLIDGMKVEREHTDDPAVAIAIVIDHLTEDAKYYTHDLFADEIAKKSMTDQVLDILKGGAKPIGHISTRRDGSRWKKVSDQQWVRVTKDRQPKAEEPEPKKRQPKQEEPAQAKSGPDWTATASKSKLTKFVESYYHPKDDDSRNKILDGIISELSKPIDEIKQNAKEGTSKDKFDKLVSDYKDAKLKPPDDFDDWEMATNEFWDHIISLKEKGLDYKIDIKYVSPEHIKSLMTEYQALEKERNNIDAKLNESKGIHKKGQQGIGFPGVEGIEAKTDEQGKTYFEMQLQSIINKASDGLKLKSEAYISFYGYDKREEREIQFFRLPEDYDDWSEYKGKIGEELMDEINNSSEDKLLVLYNNLSKNPSEVQKDYNMPLNTESIKFAKDYIKAFIEADNNLLSTLKNAFNSNELKDYFKTSKSQHSDKDKLEKQQKIILDKEIKLKVEIRKALERKNIYKWGKRLNLDLDDPADACKILGFSGKKVKDSSIIDYSSNTLDIGIEYSGIKMERRISVSESGELICHNSLMVISDKSKYKGKGAFVWANMIQSLREHGVSRVEVGQAAKSYQYNGYYTWAVLGYDANDFEEVMEEAISLSGGRVPKIVKNAENFSDFMNDPKGRAWWKENGVEWSGSFDLTKDSKNMNTLKSYLKARIDKQDKPTRYQKKVLRDISKSRDLNNRRAEEGIDLTEVDEEILNNIDPESGELLDLDTLIDELNGNVSKSMTFSGHKLQGRTTWQGLDVSIENRKGSVRRGVDGDGHEWATKMYCAYGYIRLTQANDGDHLDCYLGPNPQSKKVFVVHQQDPDTKKFDEDKVMLDFSTAKRAKKAYLKQFDRPGFFQSMDTFTVDEFIRLVTKQDGSAKKIHPKRLKKAVKVENQNTVDDPEWRKNFRNAGRSNYKQFFGSDETKTHKRTPKKIPKPTNGPDIAEDGKCWRVLYAEGMAAQIFRKKSKAIEFAEDYNERNSDQHGVGDDVCTISYVDISKINRPKYKESRQRWSKNDKLIKGGFAAKVTALLKGRRPEPIGHISTYANGAQWMKTPTGWVPANKKARGIQQDYDTQSATPQTSDVASLIKPYGADTVKGALSNVSKTVGNHIDKEFRSRAIKLGDNPDVQRVVGKEVTKDGKYNFDKIAAAAKNDDAIQNLAKNELRAMSANGINDFVADTVVKQTNPKNPAKTKAIVRTFLKSATGPFVFGFLDNFILYLAGAGIDKAIAGMGFGAAAIAGLGNAVSDSIGKVGEQRIEKILDKFGLGKEGTEGAISPATEKKIKALASTTGIFTGCIVGMVPMLFGVSFGKSMSDEVYNILKGYVKPHQRKMKDGRIVSVGGYNTRKQKKVEVEKPTAIPKELEPLAREARKYSSADKFFNKLEDNNKIVYRGSRLPVGTPLKLGTSPIQKNKVFFTEHMQIAQRFTGKRRGGNLEKFYLNYKTPLEYGGGRKLTDDVRKALNDILRSDNPKQVAQRYGYDAIVQFDDGGARTEIILFDTSLAQNKSQLIDFYNKATGNVEKSLVQAHDRKNPSGGVTHVRAHYDKRTKKPEEAVTEQEKTPEVVLMPMSKIVRNPDQPRKIFDEEALELLAENIRNYGLQSPILVRPLGDKYEIVGGERRYRAHEILKRKKIAVIIKVRTDKEAAEEAVAENSSRENLQPMEEAQSLQRMLDNGSTIEDVIKASGKSKSTVMDLIYLNGLIQEIVDLLDREVITKSQASIIARQKLPEYLQEKVAFKLRRETMTPNELQAYCRVLKQKFETPEGISLFRKAPETRHTVETSLDDTIWRRNKNMARDHYDRVIGDIRKLQKKIVDGDTMQLIPAAGWADLDKKLSEIRIAKQLINDMEKKLVEAQQYKNEGGSVSGYINKYIPKVKQIKKALNLTILKMLTQYKGVLDEYTNN